MDILFNANGLQKILTLLTTIFTLSLSSLVAAVGATVARAVLGLVVFFGLLVGGATVAQAQSDDDFVTTWQTTMAGETITIPTFNGATYNYTIDCGTRGVISGAQTASGQTDDAISKI